MNYMYIVEDGEYSSKFVRGVYSTLGKACDSLPPNPDRTWHEWKNASGEVYWWTVKSKMPCHEVYQISKYEVDKDDF